jgi:hypothetical protein
MSAFVLNLLAAACMLIDHAGLLLFPSQIWMRAVGRLAFPIFAYFIGEGFYYTKNRLKYFLRIFLLGVACQIPYAVVGYPLELEILITFSISLCLMALLRRAQTGFREKNEGAVWLIAFTMAVVCAGFLCYHVSVDYGFFGILLPVWMCPFEKKSHRLAAFSAGLIALCAYYAYPSLWDLQNLCLLSIPLLLLYNGKPGKYRLKQFFYIFYPAHLAVLWGIDWLTTRFF